MTLFGSENLLITSDRSPSLSAPLVVDESYFNTALDYVLETRREYNNAIRTLYMSINEANDNMIAINESFDEFANNFRKIIDKFLAFIKSLVDRFINAMANLFKNDKYLLDHTKDFDKFTSADEFSHSMYIYTFDTLIPHITAFVEFNDDMFDLTDPNKDVKQTYETLRRKLANDFYDEFRATVIGGKTKIYSGDYGMELFAKYRNGATEKYTETVTGEYLRAAIMTFKSFDKDKNEITKKRDEIRKQYEDIKKAVEDSAKLVTNVAGVYTIKTKDPSSGVEQTMNIDKDNICYINLFYKAKADQIQEMSNIHLLAFSAKLDAIKERAIQDRQILHLGLAKVFKAHNEAVITEAIKDGATTNKEFEEVYTAAMAVIGKLSFRKYMVIAKKDLANPANEFKGKINHEIASFRIEKIAEDQYIDLSDSEEADGLLIDIESELDKFEPLYKRKGSLCVSIDTDGSQYIIYIKDKSVVTETAIFEQLFIENATKKRFKKKGVK